MEDHTLQLLVDLHTHNKRQGPGSDAIVRRILDTLQLDENATFDLVDIGCGTGASAIEILRNTQAQIVAVDFLPAFLERVDAQARALGFTDRITTCEADMDELPFEDERFDVVWSEGAIYNIGFARGISKWKRFLKTNGYMVLTEITWLKTDVPDEISAHWNTEYPEIDTAENKMHILKESGFEMVEYFVLPENCWMDEYYIPLEEGFDDFLKRNGNSKGAQEIVEENRQEIALYTQYKDCFSYGVYIAKKV